MIEILLAMMVQTSDGPAASTVVNPDWMRRPSGADIAKYYPKAALKDDLAGRAVLPCSVDAGGRLVGCAAAAEGEAGPEFAAAAVAMSETFRMRPQTKDGRPVAGGTVRIPILFLIPANLRATPVRAQSPDVKAEIVELDCRYQGSHLDNCFARGASTAKAHEVALKLAAEVTLPPLPTKRRQGRIVLPLVFADATGGVSAPDVVTRPVWHDRPTMHDVYRAYPDSARKLGLVGSVVVECRMGARGPLGDCAVASETPAGQGFGEAALSLMPRFKADAVDAFGLKVEGRKVRIPIRFSPQPPPTRGTGN